MAKAPLSDRLCECGCGECVAAFTQNSGGRRTQPRFRVGHWARLNPPVWLTPESRRRGSLKAMEEQTVPAAPVVALLTKKGWTARSLAQALGVSRRQGHNYLKARRFKRDTADRLTRLALGLPRTPTRSQQAATARALERERKRRQRGQA